jgi:hypothetical protein
MTKSKWLKSLGILLCIGILVAVSALPVVATNTVPIPPEQRINNAPTIGTVTVTSEVLNKAGYITVTLSGQVTDMGGATSVSCYFEYGLTGSYGLATPKIAIKIAKTITKTIKVMPGGVYHYRFVCTVVGVPTYGDDKTYSAAASVEESPASLTSDHSYTGNYETGTIGEALAFGELCYFKSDGKWWGTDADAEVTTAGILAVCVVGGAPNATGTFLTKGYVRDDTWDWSANGAALWVGNSPRTMVETASQPAGSGDQIRLIGYTRTSDIIRFNPDETYLELP